MFSAIRAFFLEHSRIVRKSLDYTQIPTVYMHDIPDNPRDGVYTENGALKRKERDVIVTMTSET